MRLVVFQSLWAMEGQRAGGESTGEEVAAIAAAGFDGILVPIAHPDPELACWEALDRGMAVALGCLPTSGAELEPVLELARSLGAAAVDHVNLQPNLRPALLEECVGPLREWLSMAAAAGVSLYVETHRGRMTNDLVSTVALLEALPELQLTADLSHYVVAREMRLPLAPEEEERIDRVLARSRAFHGRVAAPGQIQAQIAFPQHRPWLQRFELWWESAFRSLASELGETETVPFTVELGPPPAYAVTGADGRELSDRWAESLALMQTVRRLWARADA